MGPSLRSVLYSLSFAVLTKFANTDRKARTASLESLTTFLSSRRSLTDADAQKLWTGLYYALWMTDRPRPQQALAMDLSALVFALRPACVRPWLRAFWHVLGTQWTSIESLRLDKFLLLVRRVFAAQLRLATKKQAENKSDVLAVLGEFCFDGEGGPSGHGILPLGLRLHVLDLWVDELEREGVLDSDEKMVEDVGALVDALRKNPVKAVRERARDSYDDERLPWGVAKEEEDDGEEDGDGEEDEDGWGGIED